MLNNSSEISNFISITSIFHIWSYCILCYFVIWLLDNLIYSLYFSKFTFNVLFFTLFNLCLIFLILLYALLIFLISLFLKIWLFPFLSIFLISFFGKICSPLLDDSFNFFPNLFYIIIKSIVSFCSQELFTKFSNSSHDLSTTNFWSITVYRTYQVTPHVLSNLKIFPFM